MLKKIDFTFDTLKDYYINLIKECGDGEELFTFELCSTYGLSLEYSTIDKIETDTIDDVIFVYNQNEKNAYDYIDHFDMGDLIDFYNGLVDAIKKENEYAEENRENNCIRDCKDN